MANAIVIARVLPGRGIGGDRRNAPKQATLLFLLSVISALPWGGYGAPVHRCRSDSAPSEAARFPQLEPFMSKNEAVISAGKGVTFVNIIEVSPENQAKVIDVLNEGVEKVIRHKDGFISASILASKDGTSVINIAQWENPDNVKAVREDPAAQEYVKRTAALAKAAPNLYSVVSVHA